MRKSGQDREVIHTKEKRIRDTMLRFRVTPEEREQIERKMEQYGTDNMAAYLRKMAIDGYVIRLDLPELREISAQLGHIGGNVNQLARYANSGGWVSTDELKQIRKQLDDIREKYGILLERLAAL